ncbi:Hsp20 family protein [Candidatus Pacearchaeota archaeon]|nr:Hsp20 family protein [Candidatus Pacearchaeota archaeon]MBD3283593.1 Hsp20 family protein [Candidatus Pacearchaeota archaeon]
MKHTKKDVILEFKLPHFNRKDIDIDIDDDFITVRADKRDDKKVKKKEFFHEEISHHAFNYGTTVPKINSKKAKISFKNGILKITAPRI